MTGREKIKLYCLPSVSSVIPADGMAAFPPPRQGGRKEDIDMLLLLEIREQILHRKTFLQPLQEDKNLQWQQQGCK